MKYVLFYDPVPGAGPAARLHFDAHKALWSRYAESGSLFAIGPFSDGSGAMAVFATRQAAEDFAEQDPFVVNGVVHVGSIREWNEALLPGG